MDTVIAESGVTLDTRLLCENVIVLSLEIANNFTKALSLSAMFKACVSMALVIPCFVVNLVSEAGSVNDGERDAGSFFVQFQFYSILATVVFQSILRVQIAHQR